MGLLHILVSHFMDLRYTCWTIHKSFVLVLFILFERHIRQIVISDVLSILLFFSQFFFYLLHFLDVLILGFLLLLKYLFQYSGMLIFFHISSTQLSKLFLPFLTLASHNLFIFLFMLFYLIEVNFLLNFQGHFYLLFFSLLLLLNISVMLL